MLSSQADVAVVNDELHSTSQEPTSTLEPFPVAPVAATSTDAVVVAGVGLLVSSRNLNIKRQTVANCVIAVAICATLKKRVYTQHF